MLTRREARAVRALAETLFPNGEEGLASVDEAGVVEYLDDILATLPRRERLLIRCLFTLFEVQMVPLGGKRFSKADHEARTRNLQGWDTSDIYYRRIAFQALRSLVLWAYVDSPTVESQMGIAPGTGVTRDRNERREQETA